jgi:hypothetical protein
MALTEGRRYLRWAWIFVAVTPIALVAGIFVGEGLLASQGYDSGDSGSLPIGVVLRAALPALLVILVPPVLAALFGFAARRHGDPRGAVPAWIGVAVTVGLLLSYSLMRDRADPSPTIQPRRSPDGGRWNTPR